MGNPEGNNQKNTPSELDVSERIKISRELRFEKIQWGIVFFVGFLYAVGVGYASDAFRGASISGGILGVLELLLWRELFPKE